MIESRKAPRYVLRCRAEINDWAAVDDCLLRNVSLRRCYYRGLGRLEAHEALEGRAAPGRVVDKVKKGKAKSVVDAVRQTKHEEMAKAPPLEVALRRPAVGVRQLRPAAVQATPRFTTRRCQLNA